MTMAAAQRTARPGDKRLIVLTVGTSLTGLDDLMCAVFGQAPMMVNVPINDTDTPYIYPHDTHNHLALLNTYDDWSYDKLRQVLKPGSVWPYDRLKERIEDRAAQELKGMEPWATDVCAVLASSQFMREGSLLRDWCGGRMTDANPFQRAVWFEVRTSCSLIRLWPKKAPLCFTCGTSMRPAGSCHVCEGCGATSG